MPLFLSIFPQETNFSIPPLLLIYPINCIGLFLKVLMSGFIAVAALNTIVFVFLSFHSHPIYAALKTIVFVFFSVHSIPNPSQTPHFHCLQFLQHLFAREYIFLFCLYFSSRAYTTNQLMPSLLSFSISCSFLHALLILSMSDSFSSPCMFFLFPSTSFAMWFSLKGLSIYTFNRFSQCVLSSASVFSSSPDSLKFG